MIIYHRRPEMARQLADELLGRRLVSDAPNGLFLAAPRRTGKSSFLQHELKPKLEEQGCLVVYVDFWSQPDKDPVELLAETLTYEIQRTDGLGKRLAAALSSLKVGAVEVELDLSKLGRPQGPSLAHVLGLLSKEANRTIVVILDEAQHTLTTKAGDAAMFALKSARDQLNSPEAHRLLLVFSGSDRDKLLRLVNTSKAPFYGSTIRHLPELGPGYVEQVGTALENVYPWLAPMSVDVLWGAFEIVGRRPQFLQQVLDTVVTQPATNAGQAQADILQGAREFQRAEAKGRLQLYLGLRPIEQYVLWRMLEQGEHFRPYDADAKDFYGKLLGEEVSTPMAQAAIKALREREPPVVWKSSRGEYAVDDTQMQGWFKELQASGEWPPGPNRAALLARLGRTA